MFSSLSLMRTKLLISKTQLKQRQRIPKKQNLPSPLQTRLLPQSPALNLDPASRRTCRRLRPPKAAAPHRRAALSRRPLRPSMQPPRPTCSYSTVNLRKTTLSPSLVAIERLQPTQSQQWTQTRPFHWLRSSWKRTSSESKSWWRRRTRWTLWCNRFFYRFVI